MTDELDRNVSTNIFPFIAREVRNYVTFRQRQKYKFEIIDQFNSDFDLVADVYKLGESKSFISLGEQPAFFNIRNSETDIYKTQNFLKPFIDAVTGVELLVFGIKKNDVDWLADNLKIRYTNWEISYVDLTDNLSNIKKNFRKRYKSLINNGLRALHSEIFYGENMTEKQLDKFRELHARAAGRVTRKMETWLQQLKQIREKYGFCVFLYENNTLVNATLVSCGRGGAYYQVGANHPDFKTNYYSHTAIYLCIEFCKKIGLDFLVLDQVKKQFVDNLTDKEKSIRHFKLGFARSSVELPLFFK